MHCLDCLFLGFNVYKCNPCFIPSYNFVQLVVLTFIMEIKKSQSHYHSLFCVMISQLTQAPVLHSTNENPISQQQFHIEQFYKSEENSLKAVKLWNDTFTYSLFNLLNQFIGHNWIMSFFFFGMHIYVHIYAHLWISCTNLLRHWLS